jgi:hypothetical protein
VFFCYAQPYGDGVLFKQALVAAAWCGFRIAVLGRHIPNDVAETIVYEVSTVCV